MSSDLLHLNKTNVTLIFPVIFPFFFSNQSVNPEKDKLLNYNSSELEDCDLFPGDGFSITHFDESLKPTQVVSNPTGKHTECFHLYHSMLQLGPTSISYTQLWYKRKISVLPEKQGHFLSSLFSHLLFFGVDMNLVPESCNSAFSFGLAIMQMLTTLIFSLINPPLSLWKLYAEIIRKKNSSNCCAEL